MAKRCETCGQTPCKDPRLCAISEAAQAMMPLTGQCNGCRQGKAKGDSAHTCGKENESE